MTLTYQISSIMHVNESMSAVFHLCTLAVFGVHIIIVTTVLIISKLTVQLGKGTPRCSLYGSVYEPNSTAADQGGEFVYIPDVYFIVPANLH